MGNKKMGNRIDINLCESAKAKRNSVIAYLIVFSEYGMTNASISSLALALTATPKWVKGGNKIVIHLCKRTKVKLTNMAYIRLLRLQKLLHFSMIPFPLNSGVSSLNLHEYGMAYVSTASTFYSRNTIPCSIIFYHTSIGIRSDHMSYSTSSCTQLFSDLLYGYRRYFSFSFSRVQ